ncbi:CiaD-like domain-containing protein [Helicobacter cappadocius]|uniref:Campylobacter invasion antigen D C-terminal domain-containing protein n=1 Tax=Helicobacter cappadocius TaxID=3063998 RepID=A0AA90PTX7_9HELI|nr:MULTISPECIES: hypothetical protein [unclassified Helicobacter]MDO7253795.1 hypothetical protein [Helicobacter sp. faydin-H75]MDP2538675.1 hypothetical protein [Helicobacter sp. faydin-H76]
MELKDMILQTLTEIEESPKNQELQIDEPKNTTSTYQEESSILYALREKALVLFEGLQSAQDEDLKVKLDLVINYLQYQLSILDQKLGI